MTIKDKLDEITIRTQIVPGDIGYVTWMHGYFYQVEYNYGVGFEAYVAGGFYEFYKNYDPAWDRVWVAEQGKKIVGFLLLMRRDTTEAQLRYFIIDPEFRGIGLGKKMAGSFMEFLKEKKYKSCYLWTTNELFTAASIYHKMGFRLVEEKQSESFGKSLLEQKYQLIL
jgi:peptidyl-dipeptidase Dcp